MVVDGKLECTITCLASGSPEPDYMLLYHLRRCRGISRTQPVTCIPDPRPASSRSHDPAADSWLLPTFDSDQRVPPAHTYRSASKLPVGGPHLRGGFRNCERGGGAERTTCREDGDGEVLRQGTSLKSERGPDPTGGEGRYWTCACLTQQDLVATLL